VQITCRLVKRSSVLKDLNSAEQLSYDMFTSKGLSVNDIARERDLQPNIVMGHLASALEAGKFVDYRKGMCLIKCASCVHVIYMYILDIVCVDHNLPVLIMYSRVCLRLTYVCWLYAHLTLIAGLSEDAEHEISDAIRKEPICSG
jgi:hypothetical protein